MSSIALVALADPDPAALHDGATLARFLECPVCLVNKGADLGEARLAFIAVGADVEAALRLGRRLPRRLRRILFGRPFSDPELRARVTMPECADGIIVGDPYLTARAVARGVSDPPGLVVSDRASFRPRAPLRELDCIPAADYSQLSSEVRLVLPLHASRGYPHALPVSAPRVWELPVRRLPAQRVVEDLAFHVADHEATHFLFTDLCLNTSTEWLLDIARGVVARGLHLFWYGAIWADPSLTRPGVRLLRESGCRGLEIDLFSGSTALNRALATGADPEAAGRLVRRCHAEGIAARVSLSVGMPGERDDDRTATMAWLSNHGRFLDALSRLAPCSLRADAPIRSRDSVFLPPRGRPTDWHDGGENNSSQRTTWTAELARWADHLGIARPLEFAPRSDVVRRLSSRVLETLATDATWREDHLLEAGILHGREAFCGPTMLELDLLGMSTADVINVVEQAAALGTRELALGRAASRDALAHEGLSDVLARAAQLDLPVTVRTQLTEVSDAEALWRTATNVRRLELEPTSEDDWRALDRWAATLSARRQQALRRLPVLSLALALDANGPDDLGRALQRARAAGVDRVQVRPAPGAMTEEDRARARAALDQLAPESVTEGLLLPGAGWPPGFEITGDGASCTCPAGATANEVQVQEWGALATFDEAACRSCEVAAGCPVDRVNYQVRLGLTRLERLDELTEDLGHPDAGLGRRSSWVSGNPCLVGWDAARVDAGGELYVCPECGSEPAGNVLEQGLASLWYSRALNELRHMARTAGKALPLIQRNRCGLVCRRAARNAALLERIESLPASLGEALSGFGAGERQGG
jgi:hypothetical protein